MAHILQFIHPTLSHFVVRLPETNNFLLNPQKWPVTLFIRSNLYRQRNDDSLMYNGWENPFGTKTLLKMIKDLEWCSDPFFWYANKFNNAWLSCTKAKSNASAFSLVWARMNRCSCIYDMNEDVPKLTLIEKQILTRLSKEVRPSLYRKNFLGKVDTPIKKDAAGRFITGNCLWNDFVLGKERKETKEDLDDIDVYVSVFELTEVADKEMHIFSKELKLALRSQFNEVFSSTVNPSNVLNHQPVLADSKWQLDESLRKEGFSFIDKENIHLVTLKKSSPCSAIAALSIFAHASRLVVLLNETTHLNNWQIMAKSLFSRDFAPPGDVNTFVASTCKEGTSYSTIWEEASIFFKFGKEFVRVLKFTIADTHTSQDVANTLIEALTYDERTGLYVFILDPNCVLTQKCSTFAPMLLQKDGKHFQCIAAVHISRTTTDRVHRLVTKSSEGIMDNGYFQNMIFMQSSNKEKTLQLKVSKPSKITTDKTFPFWLNKQFDQLYCLVYIPTITQKTVWGSNFSMELDNSLEKINSLFSTKDYLSLATSSHMTQIILRTMVDDAINQFRLHEFTSKNPQDFVVSDTVIKELSSLFDSMHETNSLSEGCLTTGMKELAMKCTVNFTGVTHLLLGYEDVNNNSVWLYAYFLKSTQSLVILSCSSDPVREVVHIASILRDYLSIVANSRITIVQLQWKKISSFQSNSGYYVFKEFIQNAREFKKTGHHYYFQYLRDRDLDFSSRKKPSWILMRNFTSKQMDQIQLTWQTELFKNKPQSHEKLYELLEFL